MRKIIYYIGLDVHKESITVAIASSTGELRLYGKIGGKLSDVDRLIRKLQKAHPGIELRFCYEAGPTGFALCRHLTQRKFHCIVVAPFCGSKPHKTDKRDAQDLARSFRAGDLSGIYVPTPEDEAIRDLVRARDAAIKDQRRARARLKGVLLRLNFRYTGKTSWTQAHENYLAMLAMPSPAQQLVFEEYKQTISEATQRVQRLTAALPQHLEGWRWKPVVQALMCLRGVDVIHAMTLVAEVGDFSRFDHPSSLMGYLGLVPSEDSSGPRRRQGSITKCGNEPARRALVEAAHNYRMTPRVGYKLQQRQHGQSQSVLAIAWKAQLRLSARNKALRARLKKPQIVVTALARELVGFVWAIACTAMGKPPPQRDSIPTPQNRRTKPKVYILKPNMKFKATKKSKIAK